MLSESTTSPFRLVKDKPNFKFEYRGLLEFKNVPHPVACYFLIENTEKEDFGPIVVADEHSYEGFIVQPSTSPTSFTSAQPHTELDSALLHKKLSDIHQPHLHVPDIMVSDPTPLHSPHRSPIGSPRRAQSPPILSTLSSGATIEAVIEGLKGMCPMAKTMDTLHEEEVGGVGEGKATLLTGDRAKRVASAKKGDSPPCCKDDSQDKESKASEPHTAVAGTAPQMVITRGVEEFGTLPSKLSEEAPSTVGEKRPSLESDVSSVADISDTSSHQSYDVDPWKFPPAIEGGGATEGVRKTSNTSVTSAEEEHERVHQQRSRSGSVHDRVVFFDSLGRIRRTGVVNNALVGGKSPQHTATVVAAGAAMTYEDAYIAPSLPGSLAMDRSSTLPRMKMSLNTESERPNRKSLDSQGSSGSGDPE